MSSGSSRLGGRLDGHGGPAAWESLIPPPSLLGGDYDGSDEVALAVASARDWLLDHQHVEGYWIGELEGDTILESEYILLLTWMGRGQSEIAQKCARTIVQEQLPTGGWALFPGGPLEISASVKAYWTLKITGHDPQAEYMVRACEAIRAAGGAEKVNSFTRFYFALLGIISYQQCPAVPPELMFLPSWMPFNIYEMSAWSRTIVVPLSLIWAFQPSIQLPPEHKIDELFLNGPANLPVTMPPSGQLDDLKAKSWVNWHKVFGAIDVSWKLLERLHIKPLRRWAIRKASKWMVDRFAKSDGLGAIFPPIIWSIISLRCLGYSEDSPEVQTALKELEKLTIHEGDTARLEPCRSPVWDTAISVIALREAGVSADAAPLRLAIDWLLSKEVREPGDWSVRKPEIEPAGWYFEFNNEFYPDIDDTIMTTMALAKCLPGTRTPRGRQSSSPVTTSHEFHPWLTRSTRWCSGRQHRPVAQLRMSTDAADAVGDRAGCAVDLGDAVPQWRLGGVRCRQRPRAVHQGPVRGPQRDDRPADGGHHRSDSGDVWPPGSGASASDAGAGDQLCLERSTARQRLVRSLGCQLHLRDLAGPRRSDRDRSPRKRPASAGGGQLAAPDAAVQWRLGETPLSYDRPELRGTGTPTPSQTAWALMGLMAVGDIDSEAVQRGIQYLVSTQREDGTWDEPEFTGYRFPRVFYLRYHLYRHYWPLMALGRYRALRSGLT